MKISPVAKFGMLAAFAAGSIGSALLIAGSVHSSAPTQIVVRQDAATATITSSAPESTAAAVKRAAPKPAVSTSSVAVKQPATVQEAPVVTDPTQADTSAADPAPTFQPIKEHPGPGNAPSSMSVISIPTVTADPSPSN